MIANSAITDFDRFNFISKLAKAMLAENGLIMTPWERSFVASWRSASRQTLWFTEGRRGPTDALRMKYGSEPEINMPYPLADTSPVALAAADAGCCEFIVREEGQQRRCNDPATQQRRNTFRYCAAHAEAVQRDLKRRGITMHLFKYP